MLMEDNTINNNIIGEAVTGIYRKQTLEKIKNIKGLIQKVIIWALIGGAICGAFLIVLVGTGGGEVLGKFMGTLFILAGAALVSLIDFNKIESKISSVQVFATIGVVANILWMLLWIFALWGLFDIWSYGTSTSRYYSSIVGYSPLGLLTMISTYLSSLGFFGALTLGIYEGEKKSTIRPLKITAISCLVYVEFHAIINLFTQFSSDSSSSSTTSILIERFNVLATFAGFVWFVAALVAYFLGRNEQASVEMKVKKEKDDAQQKILEQAAANIAAMQVAPATPSAPKTDIELRAEIEEKVRREMIEKEVRAKLEKEMAEKAATPAAEAPVEPKSE